jgi:hypothetical protein
MHALLVLNLIGYVIEEKYKNKDFACFYENLTNSEASSESRILFFCTGFPLSLVDFLQSPLFIKCKKVCVNVQVLGGFQNDILGPQAGYCKRFQCQNCRFRASGRILRI